MDMGLIYGRFRADFERELGSLRMVSGSFRVDIRQVQGLYGCFYTMGILFVGSLWVPF